MLTIKTIIQKYKAKELTREQALDLLDQAKAQTAVSSGLTRPKPETLADAIKQYLARKLGQLLSVEVNEISANENFMDLGVDSTQLIALVREIETEIGIELYPTLLFEYQNADTLAAFMAQEYQQEFSTFLKIDPEPEHAEPVNPELNQHPERPLASAVPVAGRLNLQVDQNPGPISRTENAGDIAVIGMAGVFPKSPNVERFWQHLYQKTNLITEIPTDHFDYRPWYDPQIQAEDMLYCKWGSFIDDVDKFDAPFFNISPREAASMDPQLRYLLQVLYHTAEDAGYAATIRSSNTGMYVGVCSHDYLHEMSRRGKKIQAHDGTGNAATMLANRPSFYFNLTGPSLALDTACSSSLYALHVACQALQAGECEMAFAAGANLLLSSAHYRYFCSIGALSPSGRCHTFDRRADGYVPGETVAAVLLKPLSKAVQDGDHIYGVIKGSAVRHGGYTPSITAPSVDGEANVLLSAWRAAGLDPETLDYIEAHGTGTQLGDPVEIEALNKAFRTYTDKAGFCGIGSAKAHLGHAEGAAGIVGLIKTLLSMQHGIIPAMPDFEELNPYIKLESSPFYINREPVAWPKKDGLPRRAGVSSFGFGGAYAHVIIEEYQEAEAQSHREASLRRWGAGERLTDPVSSAPQHLSPPAQLIVLSAKSEERLREYAQTFLAFLEQSSPSALAEQEPGRAEHLSAIQQSLQAMVSDITGTAPADIEIKQPLEMYGLDPVQLSHLKTMAEEQYYCELPITLFSAPASLESIARHLASPVADSEGNRQVTPQPALSLASIAYTLQVGREAMAERLVLVVSSVAELAERLSQFAQKQTAGEGIYRGNAKTSNPTANLLIKGETGTAFIESVIRNREFDKLAQLWVSGIELDWALLYPGPTPQRISLPTYPFARQRYWTVIKDEGGRMRDEENASAFILPPSSFQLHPLVHRNISDLEEQCFSTLFTGSEFFLDDHRVQGEKVLPGVAYLEMARAAAEMAVRGQAVSQLKDVVWVRPLVVKDEPVETHLGLYPADKNEIAFKVSSNGVVYSQGKLVVGEVGSPEPLNIPAIEARCLSTSEGAECYRRFREQGLTYGPAFQGLDTIRYNEREVLARLRLPASADQAGYGLHPSLLDAALQATMGLALSQGTSGQPGVYLPFAVQAVNIYGALPGQGYTYVQYSNGVEPEDQVVKYDLTLTDAQGQIRVMLKGFTVRAIADQTQPGILYSAPSWQIKPLDDDNDDPGAEPAEETLLLIGLEQGVVETITATFTQAEVVSLPAPKLDGAGGVINLVQASWTHLKAIVEKKPARLHQILVVTADTVDNHLYAPLAGLLKTARLEQPNIQGKVITVTKPDSSHLITLLGQELRADNFREVEVRYDDAGTRQVKILQEVEPETGAQATGIYLKSGGVYWITGGLGGLGRIFARHFIDHGENITVILSGRSALDETGQQHLAELGQAGGTVAYLPADVGVKAEVERVVQIITEQYGPLNGIIHSAGVLRDSFMINKTEAEIDAVLAPKVSGILNIDAATQDANLDFMVLFSSIAGVMGNVGQADYAAANAFLDAFAHYRHGLVESGARSGRTLSINWPLWVEGGMAIDEQSLKLMARQSGLVPLPTEAGLQAFELLLATAGEDAFLPQVVVAAGTVDTLRRKLLADGLGPVDATPTQPNDTGDADWLAEKVQADLAKAVSEVLNIRVQDIAGDENLSEYGFDSITLTEMTNKLNDSYELDLLPTVFFEHNTLASFSHYLVEHYSARLRPYYPVEPADGPVKPAMIAPPPPPSDQVLTKTRFRPAAAQKEGSIQPTQNGIGTLAPAIAIVGISGIVPGSSDLETFWQHLVTDQDLITEIPPERWDWQAFYGDPHGQANKTKSRWGGFIPEVDKFDAAFFKISPHEAILMDPQQRLFLQTVWHCIEDAGNRPGALAGSRTGIFVGVAGHDYHELVRAHLHDIEAHSATGFSHSVLANRISYLLDIHGPSEAIDTACSSSLVAIHRAVEALHSGSCELAIAGGVNVILTPAGHIVFGKAGMLADDGRCKTFDQRANGYVRAEGVGAVFLKPLTQAEADGDPIYAVIRGTAENHGGQATSLTAPNPKAQADLLVRAYQQAHIDPATVGYIETHGTGTALGDPIEINGLKQAFATLYQQWHKGTPPRPHCGLGSVKSNIGHLETAAGIAGVLKVLLALKHQTLPATLHFEQQNPYIDLTGSPFYLVTETQAWQPLLDEAGQPLPRRAGVSSFGFGGANAHVVLEEYQGAEAQRRRGAGEGPYLIVLSARDEARLREYAQKMLAFLEQASSSQPALSLASIAYTLQVGREAMAERLALVVEDISTLVEKLTAYLTEEKDIEHLYRGQARKGQTHVNVFAQDDDLQEAISKWISKGKLGKLAQLWVSGIEVDWALLYGPDQPRRVSLPGYPFARERYWVTDDQGCLFQADSTQSGRVVDVGRKHPIRVLQPEFDSVLAGTAKQITSASPALLPDEPTLKQEQAGFERLEQFAQTALLKAFQQMGVLQNAGERYDRPALAQQLQVLPKYRRLFHAAVTLLEQAGYLNLNQDEIKTTAKLAEAETARAIRTLSQQQDRLQKKYPALTPYLALLVSCTQSLPEIIQGQVPATDVMFPNGSLALVEGIYRGTPLINYFNDLTALAVKSYIEQRLSTLRPGEKVSIVEVGAGTGSTTAFILEAIEPYGDQLEYLYSDISAGFIDYGQARFGTHYPFMKFGLFDIEVAVEPQGYPLAQAELIVAANVVHATRNIRRTLQNLKSLLKANGLLILNEATHASAFVTLTFGLLDGWWLFEDEAERIEYAPLLRSAQWQRLLETEGFNGVECFGLASLAPNEEPYGLIMAQSDGTLAQMRPDDIPEMPAASLSPEPPYPAAQQTKAVGEVPAYIEQTIREQVVLSTGLSPEQLDLDRSLAEYGVDSITGIKLVHGLNQAFGIQLQTSALLGYPTVHALTQYIYQHHSSEIKLSSASQSAGQNGRNTPIEPGLDAPTNGQDNERPGIGSLVPIQPAGTRPPFFCVHPWAGVVYPYYELAAELGPAQPFYGLQAAGLYQEPHSSIEEMASHYLAALRQVQPSPPYLLGGWSLGGLIAFEMAQQLQREGIPVDLLAIFDVSAPVAAHKPGRMAFARFLVTEAVPYIWPYVWDYFQLRVSLQEITTMPAVPTNRDQPGRLSYSWQIGKTVTKELSSLTSSQSPARRISRILTRGLQAIAHYRPQPYPGQVTLFRVERQSGPDDPSQTLGWGQLAEQGVAVHHLPGHHLNLMKKPQVQALAGQLKICLDQIQIK